MRPSIPGVPAHAQAVLNGPAHQMLLAASAHQRQAQLARAQSPGRLEPGRMRQQQRRPQALTDGTGSAAQPNMQEVWLCHNACMHAMWAMHACMMIVQDCCPCEYALLAAQLTCDMLPVLAIIT